MPLINKISLSFLISWCLISQLAIATEVFRSEDAQGRITYSDQNTVGSKQIIISDKPYRTLKLVKRVYDGDTIILEDGQRVRLLGVNTPEIESRFRASESGGVAAKEWLRQQIQRQGKKVYLELDEEKHDRYKRLLAHIYLPDGKHLNLALIENGLGIINIIPPNIRHADKMLKAQRKAEERHIGVWSTPNYQPRPLAQITDPRKGWQRFIGTAKSIKQSRKYTRLIFDHNTVVLIANDNLKLFPKLEKYLGEEIEIRGWVSRSKEQRSILIQHPSALLFR